MKKYAFIHGSIAGAAISGTLIIGLALSGGEGAGGSQWLGYLVMILAFGMIFVGVKQYRDRELGGVIRFGRAFLLGLAITGVASVVYVVAWEVNLAVTDHAFIEQFAAVYVEKQKAAGVAGEELAACVAKMETMKEQYGNPLFRVPMTFLEIFPVGLLVSLVAAAVLRRRDVLPAVEPAVG